MKSSTKRIIALALALCISLSLLVRGPVFANGPDGSQGPKYTCGMVEHTHNDSCYEQQTIWKCQSELGTSEVLHHHDDFCYDGDGNLSCYLAECASHTHDSSCYEVVEGSEPSQDQEGQEGQFGQENQIGQGGQNETIPAPGDEVIASPVVDESGNGEDGDELAGDGTPDESVIEEPHESAVEEPSGEVGPAEEQPIIAEPLVSDEENELSGEGGGEASTMSIEFRLDTAGAEVQPDDTTERLICGNVSTEGWTEHQHDDSCRETITVLACDKPEHTHNASCMPELGESDEDIQQFIEFLNKLCDDIEAGVYLSDQDALEQQYGIVYEWLDRLDDMNEEQSALVSTSLSQFMALLELALSQSQLTDYAVYVPVLNLIDVAGRYDGSNEEEAEEESTEIVEMDVPLTSIPDTEGLIDDGLADAIANEAGTSEPDGNMVVVEDTLNPESEELVNNETGVVQDTEIIEEGSDIENSDTEVSEEVSGLFEYKWKLECPNDENVILPVGTQDYTIYQISHNFGTTEFPAIRFASAGTYVFHLSCVDMGEALFADKWTLTVTVSGTGASMTASGIWTLKNSTKGITCSDAANIRVMMGEEQGWSPATVAQAKQMMETMTTEEKVGQLFLIHYPNDGAGTVEAAKALIDKYSVGGFLVFAAMFNNSTPAAVRQKIADTQAASDIPLLFSVDEEGGKVVRISDKTAYRSTKFLGPQEVKASGGTSAVESDAFEKGIFLKDLGLNVNHAPSADVSGPSGYIYARTYGGDGLDNADYVAAAVAGHEKASVSSTLKHFPGYGGTSSNTHNGFAINTLSWADFLYDDLVPFYAGMTAGNRAVMVTHNTIQCLDAENPSSLAPAVYNVLRNNLHFDGVAMTDDLNMSAITKFVGDGYASLRALQAGSDLAMTAQPDKDIPVVLNAVKNGQLSMARVNESCQRILCWKIEMGLIEADPNIEKQITIEYAATEGGSVSPESESLASISGAAHGSVATANVGYVFVNWTDEAGNPVGTDAEFVPAKNAEGEYENAKYTAVFAPLFVQSGTITAQYYAWLDEVAHDNDEYKEVVGKVWGVDRTNELPIIDTYNGGNGQKGILPENGGSLMANTRTLYVNPSTGHMITEKHLVPMYNERSVDIFEDLYANTIDSFGNTNYKISELWILKDGRNPQSTNKNDWDVYPYSDDLVLVIQDENNESDISATGPIQGATIYLKSGAIIRYVAENILTSTDVDVAFYDYDITDGKIYTTEADAKKQTNGLATSSKVERNRYYVHTADSGINSQSNYDSNDSKLAVGNANTGSGMQHVKWRNNLINKLNETQTNHPPVTGSYMGCTFGMVSGLNNGKLQYSPGISAPNLFNDGDAIGKTPYDRGEYSARFEGTGNSYILKNINGTGATNLDTFGHPSPSPGTTYYHIWTNDFWPMDSVPSWGTDSHDMKSGSQAGYNSGWNMFTGKSSTESGSQYGGGVGSGNLPVSDDGLDHNAYFGMHFVFDVNVSAEYIGPMDYYFYGDDDMWIFLDDTLVGDIGGVHRTVGTYVNFWDWIDKEAEKMHTHTESCYDENQEPVCGYTDNKTFRISVFYMERGASGSTCFMQFNVPSFISVPVEPLNYGALHISKTVSYEDAQGNKVTPVNTDNHEFPFVVNLYDGSGPSTRSFTYSGSKSGTIRSGDTIYLRDGEWIYIYNIPIGTNYSVEELDSGEYTVSSTGEVGTIGSNTTADAAFVNIKRLGATIEFTKVNDAGVGLPGVEFTLYSDESCVNKIAASMSDETGRVQFVDLSNGVFYMKETITPDGYKENATIYQVIVTDGVGKLVESGTTVQQIINYPVGGPELPETGGPGTAYLYAFSSGILFLALCMELIRRRKEIQP